MTDFWLSCGHHLTDRDADGGLVVTDAFLKAYLARPELAPPEAACVVERTLHAALLTEPRRPVAPGEIAAMADADARENWAMMIAFRDRLLAHRTIEAAYLSLVREGMDGTPPLFVDQLVHVTLRNALDGCEDAYVLRAAELFFRRQRLTSHEGSLIAVDEETVAGMHAQSASPLVSMLGMSPAAEIDVLNDDNAKDYWERSDRFDMALDLTAVRRGLAALGEVMTRWLGHLLALDVTVEPIIEASDVDLTWYVGLDAEGTHIGDALWNDEPLDEAQLSRIVGLYRLTVDDIALVLDAARGEPIYLIMAMTPEGTLRMKPQNLIAGLPLRQLEAVS
jgi:hypothetical protein